MNVSRIGGECREEKPRRCRIGETVRPVVFAALAMAFSSCASVSVQNLPDNATKIIPAAPERVVVFDFQAKPEDFRLGLRSEDNFTKVKNQLVNNLATEIVEEVNHYVKPAVRSAKAGGPQDGDWLITGRFLRVSQGSRAARATLGFGLGRTRLETVVNMYRVANGQAVRIFEFETIGSSGRMPGSAVSAATGAGVVQVAAGTLTGSFAGLSEDVDRTAYEIAAVLSDTLARRGLLGPERKPIRPKISGQIPTSFNTSRAIPTQVRNWVRGAPPE